MLQWSPQALAEIAGRREVALDRTPFAVFLLAMSTTRPTVVVEARYRQVVKRIVLERGVPVDCTSNLAHEAIHRYLADAGQITEEVAARAFEESIRRNMNVGDVLVEHRWISHADLFRAMQQNLAKKMLDIFSWRTGTLSVLDTPPRIESALALKVPLLIVMGARVSPISHIEAALETLPKARFVLPYGRKKQLGDLKLSPAQVAVADRFATPELIDVAAPPGNSDARRLVYSLVLLGMLTNEQTNGVTIDTLVDSGRSFSGAFAITLPSAPIDAQRREELYRAYTTHRRKDAFELLELPSDATVRQIEAKYLAFATRFLPEKFAEQEGRDLYERAKELFLAGARAYAQLTDFDARAALLRRRASVQMQAVRVRDVAADVLLDAKEHFKKGLALSSAGDFSGALQQFELAADCEPLVGAYRAEAAYCRHRLANGANSALVLEELAEAQRLDPNCGIAFFYAGEVHRHLKNWGPAEASLRRAAKLMAPDRRPLNALHELVRDRPR